MLRPTGRSGQRGSLRFDDSLYVLLPLFVVGIIPGHPIEWEHGPVLEHLLLLLIWLQAYNGIHPSIYAGLSCLTYSRVFLFDFEFRAEWYLGELAFGPISPVTGPAGCASVKTERETHQPSAEHQKYHRVYLSKQRAHSEDTHLRSESQPSDVSHEPVCCRMW